MSAKVLLYHSAFFFLFVLMSRLNLKVFLVVDVVGVSMVMCFQFFTQGLYNIVEYLLVCYVML